MKLYKSLFTTFFLLLLLQLVPLSHTKAQELEEQPILYLEQNEEEVEVTESEEEEISTTDTVSLQENLTIAPTYSFTTILFAILIPCLFLVLAYLIFKLVKF